MNKKPLVPKYRFPEFRGSEEWSIQEFGNLIDPIKERAGTKKYTLMSITAGVGLVSQIEKFGREIAGSSYKNYCVIKKGDFAYNKSATKQFPEGYIAMLTEYEEAAVPNSIFTCFRITDEDTCPNFIDYLFQTNYHGSWLRKFISVGARAHGALNIDIKHLWNMPVVFPKLLEQQKIADCLSSLNDLIVAEDKKLEAFKAHKKGLMQKIFPAEGKTIPEWRFPEFRDSGEWEKRTLNSLAKRITERNDKDNIKRVLTNSAVNGVVDQRDYFKKDIANHRNLYNYFIIDVGDYVYNPRISVTAPVGPISKNKVGKGVMSPIYTVFKFNSQENDFYKYYFKTTYWHKHIYAVSNTGARHDRMNVSIDDFLSMPLPFTEEAEQQKIAECLCSLDELITAQSQKVEAMESYKKGLMQVLFTSIEEVGV